MAEILENPLKFPVKIGEGGRVVMYSSSLTNGEEQLLITRDCRFFLTVGDGTYKEFETINKGITYDKVTELLNDLDIKLTKNVTNLGAALTGDIKILENAVTSLGLEFRNYVTETEFQSLATTVESINTFATHDNRDVLDLFSKDDDNNPLFGGKKIIGDTSKLDAQIADLNNRSIIGSSLDYGLFRMTTDATITEVQATIPFNTVISGKLSIVNNKVQLKAGKKYKLKGILRGVLPSNGGYLDFQFYSNTKEIPLGIAGTLTNGDSLEQQTAKAYIEPDIDTEISLRSINILGSVVLHYGFSSIEVEEVGRTVIIDPAEDAKKIQFEYGDFRMSADQTTLSAGTVVAFDTMKTGNMSIINNKVKLTAGRSYRIDTSLFMNNTGSVEFGIYNETDGVCLVNTDGIANSNVTKSNADCIFKAEKDTYISVKILNVLDMTTAKIIGVYASLIIQEIAQPYYFNYYKDSINSTILFESKANAIGNFSLLDDINKYEYLIVYSSVTEYKAERATTIIKVSDIVFASAQYYSVGSFYDNNYNYVILFSFNSSKSLHIDAARAGNSEWNNPQIYKIEGIAYNYDNPYRDIVTTIDDFTVTDAEADGDITDIWNEVGI